MRLARLGMFFAAAMLATAHVAVSADPLTIRHGYGQLTNALSPVVFQKTDVLTHYGKSYVVEPIHFQGSSAEMTAIAADQVDIITVGNSSLALGVENAGLEDFRVIADGFQDGVQDYFTSPFMVRNDSGIKEIEDLKGKVLVTNVLGGSLDIAMRVILKRHNLEAKRDYRAIDAEFATMTPMLLDGKVDLIGLVTPWAYDERLLAGAHVLFTQKDAMGPSQVILLAARQPFLDKHREVMVDFFEDMLRGIKWFTDPANRDAAVAFLAGVTKQPQERLAGYMFTQRDFYRDPHARPNLDALQLDLDTQAQLGFLKSSLEVRKYADLSLLDAAAARLK
jgi:NitT/TauT family transport system substrate-binding protein